MITQKINSVLYDQRKMKVYQRHLTTVTTENYISYFINEKTFGTVENVVAIQKKVMNFSFHLSKV